MTVGDAEWTGRGAVAAAVAHVGLEDHGLELRADERAGRAGVEAAGVRAVLAHVGHEDPVAGLAAAVGGHLDEVGEAAGGLRPGGGAVAVPGRGDPREVAPAEGLQGVLGLLTD